MLKWKANNDEVMHTGDFTSLYPAVNSFYEYPVGHPTIIYCPKEYDPKWFGVIKCKLLPPRGLYIHLSDTERTNFCLAYGENVWTQNKNYVNTLTKKER